jgi:hypothetical protein
MQLQFEPQLCQSFGAIGTLNSIPVSSVSAK